jgi:hypothetical protein
MSVSPQSNCHVSKRGQCRFEMLDDFLLQHIGWRQVIEVVQTFVFQPEDVQAGLVAGDQIFVAVVLEAFGFLPLVTV